MSKFSYKIEIDANTKEEADVLLEIVQVVLDLKETATRLNYLEERYGFLNEQFLKKMKD